MRGSVSQKSKRSSYRSEREFGVAVGAVLLLLSLWWIYRGKFQSVAYYVLFVGSLLVLLGLLWPRLLVLPNRLWMAFASLLSYISTRIILAVVFFGILTPIGLIKRMMGWDPLRRREGLKQSYWHPYPERSTRHYEKMY